MWYPLLAQEGKDNSLYLYIGAGVGGLVVLFILYKVLFGKSNTIPDQRKSLRENLADFPPAPNKPGPRLTVNGIPVRVRLVVVCPTGAASDRIATDDLGELLDEVLQGFSGILDRDKPRVKVWPPQLSVTGFAPTFHQVVESPDPEGAKSPWILLAGPARAGGKPMLLGLAVYAETAVKLGRMTLQGKDWQETLRIER
jgi:hypothetical protein